MSSRYFREARLVGWDALRLATLWAVCITIAFTVSALFLDYLRNSNRTFVEFAVMAPLMSTAVAIIVIVVAIPTWAISQIIQSSTLLQFADRLTPFGVSALLASTLLSTLVSFLCYDYLVPSFRWYTDDTPYWVHGLTFERFGYAFAAQVILTFFTWWRVRRRRRSDDDVSFDTK